MAIAVVANKAIQDWSELEISRLLARVLTLELDRVHKERGEFFLPGDAAKTQEIRSNLIGQEAILRDMIDLLRADEEALEHYLTENEVEILKTQYEQDKERYGDD